MSKAQYVNPVLQGVRDFVLELGPRLRVAEQVEVDDVENFALQLMALSEEAQRLCRLVEKNSGDFHFMQSGALCEIIGWSERAVRTIDEAQYQLCCAYFGSTVYDRGKGSEREVHNLQLRQVDSASSEPGLCFSDYIFGTLSDWMCGEKMEELDPGFVTS